MKIIDPKMVYKAPQAKVAEVDFMSVLCGSQDVVHNFDNSSTEQLIEDDLSESIW